MPNKKPEGPKRGPGHPPWTEEQKQARRELNAKKRAARDAEKLKLMYDNPDKTKKELGITDRHWKPQTGGPEQYYGIKLRQSRVSAGLPPININDPKAVEGRIGEYFDFCEKMNRPPNMVGMANWLGVSYWTVSQWKNGNYDKMGPVIQKAISIIEDSLITQVQENPKVMVGGMFLLKSMFHYKEQQDIVITTGAQNDAEMSADEIAKRYLDDGKTVETTFAEEDE